MFNIIGTILLLLVLLMSPYVCILYTMYFTTVTKHSTIRVLVQIISLLANSLVIGGLAISLSIVFNQLIEDFIIAPTIITAITTTISYYLARKSIFPLEALLEAGYVKNDKNDKKTL